MKKIVLGLIFVLALAVGCNFNERKSAILLSGELIDYTNFQFVDKFPVFSVKQNIYFLLICKDPIENPKLRMQVLKTGGTYPGSSVSIAYATDINRGSDKHYVADYFVLRKAGSYVIRIFSHDDMDKPLAETEFSVEDL